MHSTHTGKLIDENLDLSGAFSAASSRLKEVLKRKNCFWCNNLLPVLAADCNYEMMMMMVVHCCTGLSFTLLKSKVRFRCWTIGKRGLYWVSDLTSLGCIEELSWPIEAGTLETDTNDTDSIETGTVETGTIETGTIETGTVIAPTWHLCIWSNKGVHWYWSERMLGSFSTFLVHGTKYYWTYWSIQKSWDDAGESISNLLRNNL